NGDSEANASVYVHNQTPPFPTTCSSSALLISPWRIILIESPTTSATVEPFLEVSSPPSTKTSILPSKYFLACATVRAEACPEGLALVAVIGCRIALASSVAIDWLEMRTPTPPDEFKSGSGTSLRAGRTKVSGPGQKLVISR